MPVGKFFKPAETAGSYDPKARRLTVNCGSAVSVGYTAASRAEMDMVDVSLSDTGAEISRSEAGPLSFEIEVDASKPARLTLTAQNPDTFAAVAQPLEILIRVRDYSSALPQGQWSDPTGCWIASLLWWERAMVEAGDRAPTLVSYNAVLKKFSKVWSGDGTVNAAAFRAGVQRHGGALRMTTAEVTPTALAGFAGYKPLLVGYMESGGYGHMNVIHKYNPGAGTVTAMDPWFPDLPASGMDTGSPYLDALPDGTLPEFKGKHVSRPLSHYQSPLKTGRVLIGYPAEYTAFRL